MLRTILKVSTGVAFGLGVGLVSAQSLRNSDQPAEFPPASYTAKQYVDSKGCVFVRAGFDGAVTWVPRVNRKRNVLCGFQPSLANAKPVSPAPATAAPAPRVATAPTVAPPRAPVAVPTQPRQTVAAAPVYTAPTVRAAPPVRVTTAPVSPVRSAPRATAPGPAPTQLARIPSAPGTTGTACPGVSALSQKYMTSSTHRVRCGPQGTAPTYGANTGTTVTPSYAAPVGGVIRVDPAPEITPPPGYRAAFDDGRFAPNRGLGTREGHAQMRLVWTSGVPRRLVDQNTGRDVSSLFPGLRFPFISFRQQKRYVAVNGWPAANESAQPTYSVSTKNTPAPAAAAPRAVASGHRFVQVGTFGVAANAQTSAARLKGLGLPVRLGTYKKAGKAYSIVLAGPFQSAAQLQAALVAARRAGFSDAFTRK